MSDFTDCENPLQLNAETSCAGVDSRINRRAFLASMAWGGAALALSPLHFRSVSERRGEDLLLCVGSFGVSDSGTLHLMQIQRENARLICAHASARPAAIARHPSRPLVYVANDVSLYQRQPRGTIETFAFDPFAGTLELVGRQPLSLSATRPQSLAVTPDGRSLLVASFGGGAYNVLAIDKSGLPSAPYNILKQVGQGSHPTEQCSSHPSDVWFHPGTGIAIAADYGAERLDILACDGGESGVVEMKVAARIPCVSGSGPSKIAMHPDGMFFAVTHHLRPALAAFRFDSEMKAMPIGQISLQDAPTAICFSSAKSVVFVAQTRGKRQAFLTAWAVDAQRGTLQPLSEIPLPAGLVTSMLRADSMLWLATDRGMIAAERDPETEIPRKTYQNSTIPDLRSMVVL